MIYDTKHIETYLVYRHFKEKKLSVKKKYIAFYIILIHSCITVLKLHVLMHLFIPQDLKFNINKTLPGAPSFSLRSLFLCCHFVSGLLCEKTMVIPGESQTESVIGWLSRPLPEFWEVIGGSEECWGVFLTLPGILGDGRGQLPVHRMGQRKHRQETGSRKRKLHPLSQHNSVTVETTKEGREREPWFFIPFKSLKIYLLRPQILCIRNVLDE